MKLGALQAFYIPVFCIGQDYSTGVAYDNADSYSLYKENAIPGKSQDRIVVNARLKEDSIHTGMTGKPGLEIYQKVERLGITAQNTGDVVRKTHTNENIKTYNYPDLCEEPTETCLLTSLAIISSKFNLIPKSERHNIDTPSIISDLHVGDRHEFPCVNCNVQRTNNGLNCSYSDGCLNIIKDGLKIVWNKNRHTSPIQKHSESCKNGVNNVNNNASESFTKLSTEFRLPKNCTNASSPNIHEKSQCDNVDIQSYGQKSMQWVKTVKVRQSKREHNMFSPSSF